MPRLAHRLLSRARDISPFLPLLLRTCRTLPSARNELRWLTEYVDEKSQRYPIDWRQHNSFLTHLCEQRGRGVPLQYLLGSQPFGDLDILCRPGVLIPRLETESYTSHFANLIETDPIFKDQISLRILDLCTGTGCIPLSSYSLLSKRFSDLEVVGVDISDKALSLSRKNLEHNVAKGLLPEGAVRQVSFRKGDVLHKNFPAEIVVKEAAWDVMISNPPYISSKSFARDTARSVRNFEPRLALVPPEDPGSFEGRGDSEHLFPEDVFYGAILKVAQASESKVVLMEVADLEQALRVAMHASDLGQFRLIELWRDWPSDTAESNSIIQNHPSEPQIQYKFNIKGQGNARSVVCWL